MVPPIFNVAPFETVIVPPAALLFAVNVLRSSVPPVTLKSPTTVALPPSVRVPADAMVKCPYVSASTVCDEPLYVTVLVAPNAFEVPGNALFVAWM